MSASPGRIAPKRRPGRRLAAAPLPGGGAARGEAGDDGIRIKTRGLTKRYDDLVAVDHLDLEVRAGEIFGLLGQNGAGKTTTILMLLGLTEPSEGSARVMGLDPSRGPLDVKRRVGYMPDSVGFYGTMTGRENLRYTARLNRVPKAEMEGIVASVLDQVGLTDRADDRTETYSRGMLQRLGIADALVKDPDVLILDEPTTAIDPLGVVEVLELLRGLVRDHGMAILLSSHLLNQVQSVCDRIGIFASGRLIGQGTMDELAARFGDGRQQIEVGLDLVDAADVDAQRFRKVLASVAGVGSVDDGARPTDPWLVTVVPGQDPGIVRSAVLAAVASNGLPLASIQAVVPSLEDVYRRAVSRPAARAEGTRRGGAIGPAGGAIARSRVGPPTGAVARPAPVEPVELPPRPLESRAEPVDFVEGSCRAASEVPGGGGVMSAVSVERTRSVPGAGWTVVAGKEFGDHLLSARFVVLVVVLGFAAAIPLYFAAAAIRDVASSVSDAQAIFIALFWLAPDVGGQFTLPSVVGFLAYVAPLLGLAFAFDAINGERAEGTLPRLLSQPIHRDDVVNGKFVAGLAIIGLVLVSVVGGIAAFGLIRLGIVPAPAELLRIVLWVLVTFVYVSLWLAVGMLLSVVVRRAATSALVGFGAWLLLTFFGGLIVSLIGGIIAPVAGTAEEVLRNNGTQEALRRLLPDTLYREASLSLLNPQVTSVSTPATIGGYEQAQQRIPSLLSLDQSFLLVWPQVVGLVAMTVACFALAYVMFMRQEVRA